MKIALLSFEFPPETGFGGIGTYTWYHARALVKLGHEVHVLAGSVIAAPLHSARQDGVIVHRYRSSGLWMKCASLFGRFGCFWTRQRLENAYCMYRGLKILSKQHHFDVIEMPECGAEGALMNWWVDTPTIVRFHSPSRLIMPFYDVPQADIIMCSWIEKLAIRTATSLTSCSAFLAAEVSNKLHVTQPITVIPNGIDLALFDDQPLADLSRLHGLPAGQQTILFAGRMERRKGIHLCAAIAKLILHRRDVTFLFAGEDIFGYLADIVLPALRETQLLGSFIYMGKLSIHELRAYTRAVDIFLLPSLWENCPYACLEAMAAGCSIVASNQGGMPELIDHGQNGLLADTNSPEAFAACLEALIDDPDLRRRLGAAARSTVEERYTDRQIAIRTQTIYESLSNPARESRHDD